MANEIDELMARVSEDPINAPKQDLDAIIAYHRRNRANAEAGIKPKKETGPKQTLDLAALGLSKPVVTAPPMKRRV